MDDPDVKVFEDIESNVFCITFLKDKGIAQVRDVIMAVQGEVLNAHSWDSLYDLSLVRSPVTMEAATMVTDAWAEIAKGRDVGRRTAIVSTDPNFPRLLEDIQAAVPHRALGVFATCEEALEWLRAIHIDTRGDIQLI